MAEHLDDFEDISAERIRSIQEDFDALSLDPDAEAVSRRESDLLSLGGEEEDSFGDSVDSLEDDFEKVSRKTAGNTGRRRKNMTEQYLDNLTELDEDAKDQAEVEIHNPVADEVRAKAARPAGYDERDRRGRRRPDRAHRLHRHQQPYPRPHQRFHHQGVGRR